MSRSAKALILAAIGSFVATGCSTTAYDFPSPLVTPSGKKGFGMRGYVSYTGDETVARAVVLKRMKAACMSNATLISLDMKQANSAIGVKHIYYSAVAQCD